MATTHPPVRDPADRELKARHRAMWASGDYAAVARDLVAPLGPELVREAGISAGHRVLDVGAGSGNAAIPAAATGASVVASDLTPELFEPGRREAAARGVELEWVEADAEALPFADDSFDVVTSCLGAMFAPHHEAAADELVRVCRPGGTIAMVNWTPEGFIGQLFKTMGPYAPPPPPGATPPPRWGSEEHVRQLFGERVSLQSTRAALTIDYFAEPIDFREYFKANYGPTIAAYKYNADDPDRVAALDRDLAEFVTRSNRGGPDMGAVFEWEYLLVIARKHAG